MKTVLMTDCCCDLTAGFVKENNIVVMSMTVTIGDKEILDDLGQSLKYSDFYKAIREGQMPKTAQVNEYAFEEKFREITAQGDSIIYIAFSSALSGTYNSARLAKETILEENKDADITIIDSKCASMGLGLLVYYANKMLIEGKSKEEIIKWVEENKLKIIHWFTVDDLNHLYRGGRVSKTSATVGTLLNIKPVMHVDDEGRLIPVEKARGRKKSISTLINKIEEQIVNPQEQVVFISHGDDLDEAEKAKDEILSRLKVQDVMINYVGSAVGAHSGPGTIAIFCLGEKR